MTIKPASLPGRAINNPRDNNFWLQFIRILHSLESKVWRLGACWARAEGETTFPKQPYSSASATVGAGDGGEPCHTGCTSRPTVNPFHQFLEFDWISEKTLLSFSPGNWSEANPGKRWAAYSQGFRRCRVHRIHRSARHNVTIVDSIYATDIGAKVR